MFSSALANVIKNPAKSVWQQHPILSSISDHLRYRIRFLIPHHPPALVAQLCLQQESCWVRLTRIPLYPWCFLSVTFYSLTPSSSWLYIPCLDCLQSWAQCLLLENSIMVVPTPITTLLPHEESSLPGFNKCHWIIIFLQQPVPSIKKKKYLM